MRNHGRALLRGDSLKVSALAVLGLAACLPGCVAGPNYRPPDATALRLPDRLPSASRGGLGDAAWFDRWWTCFNDPALSRLVETALSSNLDLQEGQERLRQSLAQVASERAAFLPTLGVTGGISRTVGSNAPEGDYDLLNGSLQASWEIDVAGGIRRSVEAARAITQGRAASLQSIRISVAGEAGRRYVDARLAQTRIDITRESLASQARTLQITIWRLGAGLGTSIDVQRARQLVAETGASLPDLEVNYRIALNRLAVLTGAAPGGADAFLEGGASIPGPNADFPAMPPLDLVRRRPDVAQAERTLAAETARIGVQKARLYPSLSLSGSFGGTATGFSGLLDALVGSLSALVSQTFLDSGRRRADIAAQQAAAAAALASYRSAVLEALEDADNAYATQSTSARRSEVRERAETAARRSAEAIRTQYRSGLVDFTTLLDAERTLLSSSDARAVADASRAQAAISLIQALGGAGEPELPRIMSMVTR